MSFTPTSVIGNHNYILGLHKDNNMLDETWGGTEMDYNWQGAGDTGKAYAICRDCGNIVYTASAGTVTTDTVLKVEYNFDTNVVKWYKDGSQVASVSGESASEVYLTAFTKKGATSSVPVGGDNILHNFESTGSYDNYSPIGTEHHYSFTRDGNTWSIYQDGALEATATSTETLGSNDWVGDVPTADLDFSYPWTGDWTMTGTRIGMPGSSGDVQPVSYTHLPLPTIYSV